MVHLHGSTWMPGMSATFVSLLKRISHLLSYRWSWLRAESSLRPSAQKVIRCLEEAASWSWCGDVFQWKAFQFKWKFPNFRGYPKKSSINSRISHSKPSIWGIPILGNLQISHVGKSQGKWEIRTGDLVYALIFSVLKQSQGRIIESWSGLIREMFPTADNTWLVDAMNLCFFWTSMQTFQLPLRWKALFFFWFSVSGIGLLGRPRKREPTASFKTRPWWHHNPIPR